MRIWTEQEVTILLNMWPTASRLQIANTLHRSPNCIGDKAKWLRDKGLLEGKKSRRNAGQSVKPDQQHFDAVKRDYCLKHHIDIAQLNASFASDNRLAADLYRLAQAAKVIRLRPRESDNHRYLSRWCNNEHSLCGVSCPRG
jgi:hypothetical protein